MADEQPATPTEKPAETAAPAAAAAAAPAQATVMPPELQNDGVEHHGEPHKLGILNDVSIALTIEVGRAQIKIRDLLNLSKGSIIELNKSAGDPVEIYANGKLISVGNIITANGKYCVRLTSMPQNNLNLETDTDGK